MDLGTGGCAIISCTVADDGVNAQGRSRTFMQIASHDDAVKDDRNPLAREFAFRAWWEG
jgi:hypothetical protein